MSNLYSYDQLFSGRCVACEGGVPRFSLDEAAAQLSALSGWVLLADPERIQKSWIVQSFAVGMEFLQRVADLAELERHHPDIRLTSYRNVSIEIWTHAIHGLSLNDFVLAAKIDQLPVRLRVS